jgi:hypothetical protein
MGTVSPSLSSLTQSLTSRSTKEEQEDRRLHRQFFYHALLGHHVNTMQNSRLALVMKSGKGETLHIQGRKGSGEY